MLELVEIRKALEMIKSITQNTNLFTELVNYYGNEVSLYRGDPSSE